MTNLLEVHNVNPKVFVLLGVQMKILLSSSDTGGQFSLVEGTVPPGGDGGLHAHLREDESMHLLEGRLEVTIGDKAFDLRPGESYFAPRGIPHRLRNRGSIPARGLVIMSPSRFDEFIARAAVPLVDGEAPPPSEAPTAEQLQRLLVLAQQFGIEILDPSAQSTHPASGACDREHRASRVLGAHAAKTAYNRRFRFGWQSW